MLTFTFSAFGHCDVTTPSGHEYRIQLDRLEECYEIEGPGVYVDGFPTEEAALAWIDSPDRSWNRVEGLCHA